MISICSTIKQCKHSVVKSIENIVLTQNLKIDKEGTQPIICSTHHTHQNHRATNAKVENIKQQTEGKKV